MKNILNGVQWYWYLREFCKEDKCFLVTEPAYNSLFIVADKPIDKFRGEHYMKVNVTKTYLGYRVERGKKNLIIHESLLPAFGKNFSEKVLIPWEFCERKAYKEKAEKFRKQKREELKELEAEKMKDPVYAKKKEQRKKRREWIDKTKRKNIDNPTKSELLLLKTALKRFGKRVETQHEIIVNGHIYFLDFYIKSLRVAIEVDGGYHSTAEQYAKDRERDANLASVGIKTIRIKNEQVPIKACIEELLSVLQGRKKKNGLRADFSIDTHFIGQRD